MAALFDQSQRREKSTERNTRSVRGETLKTIQHGGPDSACQAARSELKRIDYDEIRLDEVQKTR